MYNKHMKKVTTVDEYIEAAPPEIKERLMKIRKIIKETAPDALEKLSYGMPYYGYKGRLVYFAYFKNHIGLYIPPPVIAEHKKELKEYKTAMATVQFPHIKKLPLLLIKELIIARMKKNKDIKKKG